MPGLIGTMRQAAAAAVLAAMVAGCVAGHAEASNARRLPGLYLGSMAGDWYGPTVRPGELLLGADWTISN